MSQQLFKTFIGIADKAPETAGENGKNITNSAETTERGKGRMAGR